MVSTEMDMVGVSQYANYYLECTTSNSLRRSIRRSRWNGKNGT